MNQRGFTVLEMLIAITVFSVMLLLTSAAILQLSRQFYKGLVKSRTQQAARNISEEIITNLQFSASRAMPLVAEGSTQGYCIADRRYMYALHKQLGSGPTQTPGVLLRDSKCSEPLPATLTPTADTVELIGENMRLANLVITPDTSGKIWYIKVRVVYGDDDLVCNPTAPGDCESDTPSTTANRESPELTCKFKAGSQYCAAAEYEATVSRRL